MKHDSNKSVPVHFDASKLGVTIDEKGHTNINKDRLVKSFLKIRPIVYQPESKAYYKYDNSGFYREISVNDIDKDIISILDDIVPDMVSGNLLKEIERILPARCISTKKLKDASNYINVKNGLLNLVTFTLKKHTKRIFTTRQLACEYNPDAKAPNWIKFTKTVFLGDIQLCRLLQEVTGYAISPKTEAQAFFFLYSGGSSGKSIYCKILTMLFGGEKFVSNVTLGDLNSKFARRQLFDASCNIATENEVKSFSTETIKALTGPDSLQIEGKFEKAFSAVITAKQIFALNNLPKPKDITYAFYRRLVIVPFLARFVDEPKMENEFKRNPEILKILEPELEGILSWSIRGLKRLIKNGYKFTHSDEAEKLLNEYRRDIDPVLDFYKASIKAESNSKLSYEELYEAFENYRKSNGIKATKERREFIKELRYHLEQGNVYSEIKHSNKVYFLTGIAFKKSFDR